MSHQLADFIIAEKGRRSAPPMQLHGFMRALQRCRNQFDFLAQTTYILGRTAMIAGHYLVAGAVITDGVAKRDVNV